MRFLSMDLRRRVVAAYRNKEVMPCWLRVSRSVVPWWVLDDLFIESLATNGST